VPLPDGGVFAWPRLTDRVSVGDFARAAADESVLVIPGEQFAVAGSDAARHFRASFGQHDEPTLAEAARRLASAYCTLEANR
jgi:DNA-binding transcriptional MocR family regulator